MGLPGINFQGVMESPWGGLVKIGVKSRPQGSFCVKYKQIKNYTLAKQTIGPADLKLNMHTHMTGSYMG